MSATEAVVAPAPVEEAKPTETAPVAEPSAPVAEVPKADDVAAPVRLLLCSLHFFVPNFYKEVTKSEATQVYSPPFPVLSPLMHFSPRLLTGRC